MLAEVPLIIEPLRGLLLPLIDIRVWLGLPRMSIRVITRVRDEVKERWLKESG